MALLLVAALLLGACANPAVPEADGKNPTPTQTAPTTPAITPTPTSTLTPEPTPTPDPIQTAADALLADMSLEEKIYQLFIVSPSSLNVRVSVTSDTDFRLIEHPVGGFILKADDLQTGGQTKKLIKDLQSISKLGLFITVDEEGGRVTRLMQKLGTTRLSNMYSYRAEGADTAYLNALTIAGDLREYSFNIDFAPVADVFSNPQNTVIGNRAYSDDFSEAATLISAAVNGFHDGGVICCLKHFPGHGDTAQDSHNTSAIVTKTLGELREQEFLPFLAGIEAGADMVMIGHLTVPYIDDEPATVSKKIIDLLRNELNFDGAIITDALNMGALKQYTTGELAVKALQAGIDILLEPADLETAARAIMEAVQSGELTKARIDESVLRVLKLKLKYGIINSRWTTPASSSDLALTNEK